MCGRYLRRSDKQRIAETFRVGKGLADLVLPPWDYNVAPTSYQLVIRSDRDTGERELALMRWGLVPYFAKDLKSFAYSTINARAESLSSSVIFSGPFERRRCLIPADGFYEWKKLATMSAGSGEKPEKKKAAVAKQPFVFTLAPVHNRMPVMLQPQDYDLWLSHVPAEMNTPPVPQLELIALLRPYPADRMEAREAHMDVGNVRNNHPGLMNSA
jgi:putative SOS response-associated peptidase YedK